MTIEAWFMDDSDADQRLDHRLEPNEPASLDDLAKVGSPGLPCKSIKLTAQSRCSWASFLSGSMPTSTKTIPTSG
jgi:hypothetical protein